MTSRRGLSLRAVVAVLTAASCLVVAALAGAGGAQAAFKQRATALDGQVKVTMDKSGIPHIVAKNFTALGYGEGYEFAADNLCTFANDMVTVESQRSRYFGANKLAVNYSAGTVQSNENSDLYWDAIRSSGIVKRELTAAPPNGLIPQVRQVYTGFISGYNRYLKSGKLNDPTCKGKAWVKPINMTDMLLRGYQIVTEASSAQMINYYDAATRPSASAPAVRTAADRVSLKPLKALGQRLNQADRAQGSNGIGLGANDTQAHTGMVLANPHFPWRGTERFWMAQLDVPGQYDMEGGTLEGFPLVGIGFNRNVAWTHTVSTDMRFVVYQLNLVKGHPTEYKIGNKIYKMKTTTVTLKYGKTTVHHTFYTSKWGMVASIPGSPITWTATHAYAVDDFTADGGARAADEYFNMGRATSVHDLYNVEAKWLAIPTFNTIAADDKGWSYYGDVGATPAVSAAQLDIKNANSCIDSAGVTAVGAYLEDGIVLLNGARANCAPANTKGTPTKGIFPGSKLPHIFERSYVENSNNSFWLANPTHPLTGFSPIIGKVDQQQNGRTRLGNAMIAARVAGTDGLGKAKFSIATLQKMWESDKSQLALDVLPQLVSACQASPNQTASNGAPVDLTTACQALAGYNGTGKLDAAGGWLFMVWAYLDTDSNTTNSAVGQQDIFYNTPFNAKKPLTTPTGLNTTAGTPLKYLADAVQNLQAHNVALDATIGQVQYAPQSKSIPIPGCFGESGGQDAGCFNAIYSPADVAATNGPVSGGPYGQVNDGSSLVMTTQLGSGGPVSQGILTYSQATNPKSPWYANMTKDYSAGTWVKLPYSAKQLAATHPYKTVTLTMK